MANNSPGSTSQKEFSLLQFRMRTDKLQNRYAEKFIALYKGRVIAFADTSKILFKKIKNKLGDKNLLIQYIPRKDSSFSLS